MTCPRKNPFKLHFLPGMEDGRFGQVPAHLKREFGWLPNRDSGRSPRRNTRPKRKK